MFPATTEYWNSCEFYNKEEILEELGSLWQWKNLSDWERSISATHLHDLLDRKPRCPTAASEIKSLAISVPERRQKSTGL